MRAIYLLSLLLFTNLIGFSQVNSNQIAVVNLNPYKENDLYFGITNKYKIVVEGLLCNEFSISSNNCIIRRNGCFLEIELKDSTLQYVDIYITYKGVKEKIILMASIVDKPNCFIKGMSSHNSYNRLDSIVASSNIFDIEYEIVQFKANFVSNGKLIYSIERIGNKFSDEDRKQFLNMRSGDTIEIFDVSVIGNKKIFQKLDGAKFPVY